MRGGVVVTVSVLLATYPRDLINCCPGWIRELYFTVCLVDTRWDKLTVPNIRKHLEQLHFYEVFRSSVVRDRQYPPVGILEVNLIRELERSNFRTCQPEER